MTFVLPTTAPDTVVAVPVGTTTGTVLVLHSGCTYRGTSRDTSIIALDDATGSHIGFVFAGGPFASMTIEDCTIDAGNVSTLTALITAAYYACLSVTLRRVRIKNYHKNTIGFATTAGGDSDPSVTWVLEDVIFEGDGRAIVCTGSSGVIENVDIYGGAGGLTVAENGPACTIIAEEFNGHHGYWQGSAGETVIPTAFDASGVDVVSNVTADRNLYDTVRVLQTVGSGTVTGGVVSIAVQRFDRVEVSGGVWSEVDADGHVTRWHAANSWRPAATPADGAAVAVLRPILGRALTWNATRIAFQVSSAPAGAVWRRVDGTALTPTLGSVARVEILRVKASVRDVDTGGIHLTRPCVGCSLIGGTWFGWWSDQVSDRGDHTVITDYAVANGQDMGFTLTGHGTRVLRCSSDDSGVGGYLIESDGRSPSYMAEVTLIDCTGEGNMRHGYADQTYYALMVGDAAFFDAAGFDGTRFAERNAVLNPGAHVTITKGYEP